MKQETDKLHEEYYKKFGRLHSSQNLLSSEIYNEMANNLLEEYRTEYELMNLRDQSETERTKYELETRNGWIIPRFFRRFIFWKRPNRAADQINRELAVQINEYFNKRERALERLIAALDRTDENSESQTADDETAEEQSEQQIETPENVQNTDEGESNEREQAEHTDEQTPADKPEETPTDGAQDQPTAEQNENQTSEQKPRRRRKHNEDEPRDNAQMPGQMAIEMPPDTDDPGQADE